MHKKQNILDELSGGNAGMTVPEGFFNNFNKKMSESLPQQPWEIADAAKPNILPKTRWQIVRPYVYLAAMFMGIWCMLKMFNLMQQKPNSTYGIESNTTLLSAIDNDAFYYEYCTANISDTDIYDELYESGINPDDLLNE